MCKPWKKILLRAEKRRPARKSTIVVFTKMKINSVRHIFFELSNRISHENLFSSPFIYKQANRHSDLAGTSRQ